MYPVSEPFSRFTAYDCDRTAFVQKYLSDRSVATSIVPIDGKKHIYVNFPSSSYNPMFKIKTVVVHYDRAEGSPGANDNSAAVFSVMDWSVRLIQSSVIHNVRIFFTDGEELGSSGGVRNQGAFGIAALFRKLGITSDDVYVFDACGRGEVPVIARTVPGINVSSSFRRKFNDLYDRTVALIRTVSPQKWLSLPVPYSDNAGFLACGIPAVAVTLLPSAEAENYMHELLRTKDLEFVVMNRSVETADAAVSEAQLLRKFECRKKMPPTWQLFHTENDNEKSLTPESFSLMERLLAALAKERTLA
jgi:hypothetical protein